MSSANANVATNRVISKSVNIKYKTKKKMFSMLRYSFWQIFNYMQDSMGKIDNSFDESIFVTLNKRPSCQTKIRDCQTSL